jgi:hypothetical protein
MPRRQLLIDAKTWLTTSDSERVSLDSLGSRDDESSQQGSDDEPGKVKLKHNATPTSNGLRQASSHFQFCMVGGRLITLP